MSVLTHEINSRKIAQAAVWTSGSILLVRLFFLISSIITARLLNSEDFGLIGIAGAIYMIIDTTSATGIGNFLIYKQDLTIQERNTAFTMNLLIGLFFGCLVVFSGCIIGHLYHKPEVEKILLFSGIAFFISTMSGIPKALLIKNMKQQTLAIIDVAVNFLNFLLIIVFSLCGFKYLSYVIPLLIYQAAYGMILFFVTGQYFKLSLNKEIFLKIFKYSRSFTPQILLADLLYQVDYLIGSAFLSSAMLGYYYFGFEKAFLLSVFTRGISEQVLFPVFSKSQADMDVLKQNYFKLGSYVMFILFPILGFVILQAQELLPLVYGDHWNNSIFTFQCILSFFLLKVNYDISITLFNAIGKTHQNLKHFLCVIPHTVLFFFIGVSKAGLMGLSIAALMAHSLSGMFMMYRLSRYFKWSLLEQVTHLFRYLVPLFLVVPVTLFFKYLFMKMGLSALVVIFNLIFIFVIFYISFSWLINPEIIKDIYGFTQNKLQRKFQVSALDGEDIYFERADS